MKTNVKLDEKNKKILYELSKNCRIPSIRLAKIACVSREVIEYRIKKLVEKGVITSFVADIDIGFLGCTRYLVYLELQNVDEIKETEILKKVVANPFVSWTTTQTGKWNVIFDVIAKDIKQVDGVVRSLQNQYSTKISDYKIATQLEYQHYYSKYFGPEPMDKKSTVEHKMDSVDLKILKNITNDARASYIALSEKMGLTANTIKLRIQKLQKAGIIRRFTIQVNKNLLGFQPYNIQFTFKDALPAKSKKFLNHIKHHPNVNFYYFPLGHWDLEIGLFVKDTNQLRSIIIDFRNKFSDVVRIYDCMSFYEELKPNYVPEGVFEV
ncbi:MAG: Lrp/AsnC family transcriptional regulator [Candidatus Aenigmarchaeota archaeon]|nr:Lrp/AsnC family transcriptional regulator [Candidatus Aenigmarchaeota archaeon]MCK5333412.1 Lrp/AsnC family transcriptional regulator [Candidatus Aenigmarchaeota archaeon]